MGNAITRRGFLLAGTAASLALETLRGSAAPVDAVHSPERKFYAILSLGRLGFHATFPESVELATKQCFEGLDPDTNYFASLSDDDLRRLLDDLGKRSLKFGAAGLPVEFRKDSGAFNEGLKSLPAAASVLERAGVRRVSTWLMPCSNDLTYLQNFRQHADRLRQCAVVLADHGQKLGLEYVAPRTLWRSQRYPFIHTLSEMKELMAD